MRELGKRLFKKKVPYVEAIMAVECGAACLASVLTYHGKPISIQQVRGALDTGSGASAATILEAAHTFGLIGRGLKVEVDQLEYLDRATILHWNFNHFVVFERTTRWGVWIVDPAVGRRRVPFAEFRKSFTGVALDFEPSADFKKTGPTRSHFLQHLFDALLDRGLWLRILVTTALIQLFHLAVPLMTGMVVDTVVPAADKELMWVLGLGLGLIVALHFVGAQVRGHLLVHLKASLDARMTPSFFNHLTHLPFSFFRQVDAPTLGFLMTSPGSIRDQLTSTMLTAGLDGALILSYFALLFSLAPTIATITLILCLSQLGAIWLTRGHRTELLALEIYAQSEASSRALDILLGIETIKGLGVEGPAVEMWSHRQMHAVNIQLKKGSVYATLESVIGTLRFGAPLLILGYGASLVIQGELGLGTMLAVNAIALGITEPMYSLIQTATQWELIKQHALRMERVLVLPTERSAQPVTAHRPATGDLRLENVGFRYGPLSPPALENITLHIRSGQFVAFVGRSGSGKSTLASLIAGMNPPTEGKIFYDGQSGTELDITAIRKSFGYVPQKPFMLTASVKANISFLDDTVSMDAVEEAAKRACVHEEIVAMPMGYETVVIGDGGTISGGQKQRIALARALVRKPSVMILDEATSALDSVTERAVVEQLDAAKVTRIVVAHRLSTVINADLIVVLDQGRIVEQGTHAELLARRGVYHSLVSSPSDGA